MEEDEGQNSGEGVGGGLPVPVFHLLKRGLEKHHSAFEGFTYLGGA